MKIHEIEKGIEIPLKNLNKYPFDQMEVGNSVLIERTDEENLRFLARNLRSVLSHYWRKDNKKFITRTIKKENGVRIWRVE